MIQAIKFENGLAEYYDGPDHDVLLNIKQINTFIGANNSGKSRLLRHLYSFNKSVRYWSLPNEPDLEKILKPLIQITKQLQTLKNQLIVYKSSDLFLQLAIELKQSREGFARRLIDIFDLLSSLDINDFSHSGTQARENVLRHGFANLIRQINDFKKAFNNFGIQALELNKIYIPILRGLRPFPSSEDHPEFNDIYKVRTGHDYFQGGGLQNGRVFTGLSIYEDVKKLLLGDESERNEIKAFEYFLKQNLFKQRVNLIPKYDDDVLHIKIGDSEQFPIYHLGDGLQTLIIILFPIFINRNEEYLIFIEEPETHLHPKWQRLLIRALGSFERHYFFISTHSSVFINHPLSSTFIVSQRNNKTNIQYSDIKSEKAQLLRELGYKPNDLFQTNYILWVEGQSDKIYLNYLIQKLDPSLQEEEDYSIMFYGGSSYKHFLLNNGDFNLEFVQALNQNYGIVLDSDRKKPGEKYNLKKKAIQQLFKKNGAFCWLTRLREIENYIPSAVFERAVKTVHKLKDIGIDQSDFGDRCKVEDLNAKPSFKSTIKLSSTVFSRVQKNKDGSTKGISAADLRKEVEASIQATKKTFQNIDKVRVADEVTRIGFDLENDELKKKMTKLVNEIKKANEG